MNLARRFNAGTAQRYHARRVATSEELDSTVATRRKDSWLIAFPALKRRAKFMSTLRVGSKYKVEGQCSKHSNHNEGYFFRKKDD
jgi:hypothetical protein